MTATRRRLHHAGAVAAAVALAACGSSGTSTPAAPGGRTVIAVVAAENTWGDITRQIGGDRVSVTSLLTDPSADPHAYESNPGDAAAIAAAALVVENGLGYDDFVDRMLGASPDASRAVVNVAAALGVGGGDVNPHLWYDPVKVPAAARAIAAALTRIDPDRQAQYSAGLDAFLDGYQPYIDTIAAIRSRHQGAPIAYTERVPGYLVDAAGLRLATPASFAQAIEDGNEPSPGDTAAMDAAISGRAVRVLLYNAQVAGQVTQEVQDRARAAGVPVVGVSETIPPGETGFASWQTAQARALLAALGG